MDSNKIIQPCFSYGMKDLAEYYGVYNKLSNILTPNQQKNATASNASPTNVKVEVNSLPNVNTLKPSRKRTSLLYKTKTKAIRSLALRQPKNPNTNHNLTFNHEEYPKTNAINKTLCTTQQLKNGITDQYKRNSKSNCKTDFGSYSSHNQEQHTKEINEQELKGLTLNRQAKQFKPFIPFFMRQGISLSEHTYS